jgi:hypothetical protein
MAHPLPVLCCFGSGALKNLWFITVLCNGHFLMDARARLGVPVAGGGCVAVTAVTAGQGQRLYSGVGFFNWRHLSPPPQVHLFQMVRVLYPLNYGG